MLCMESKPCHPQTSGTPTGARKWRSWARQEPSRWPRKLPRRNSVASRRQCWKASSPLACCQRIFPRHAERPLGQSNCGFVLWTRISLILCSFSQQPMGKNGDDADGVRADWNAQRRFEPLQAGSRARAASRDGIGRYTAKEAEKRHGTKRRAEAQEATKDQQKRRWNRRSSRGRGRWWRRRWGKKIPLALVRDSPCLSDRRRLWGFKEAYLEDWFSNHTYFKSTLIYTPPPMLFSKPHGWALV